MEGTFADEGPQAGRWAVVTFAARRVEAGLLDALRAGSAMAEPIEVARLPQAKAVDNVVCVWDAESDAEAALRVATGRPARRSARSRDEEAAAPRVVGDARGAVAVTAVEDVSVASSAAWGLGPHAHALKQPELRCTL